MQGCEQLPCALQQGTIAFECKSLLGTRTSARPGPPRGLRFGCWLCPVAEDGQEKDERSWSQLFEHFRGEAEITRL